ncbi:unnamed protein product [Rangifer tarandus platyrhynchus]|uniref:Uncharacterized protein n=2 Tax=Rangifer tarandus platyrhynchus TaxID=3082113 RepID=A0ABN8YTV0_RANTA|nr:unnamed protein product [Rangifer tarandus platyrhynchus]CAI9702589.1 unnamed protein product [Rangifer tarandus platyrhynchus]
MPLNSAGLRPRHSVLRGAGGGDSAALKQEVTDGEGNRQAFLSLRLTLTKFSETKMLHSHSSLSELSESVVKRQRDSKIVRADNYTTHQMALLLHRKGRAAGLLSYWPETGAQTRDRETARAGRGLCVLSP